MMGKDVPICKCLSYMLNLPILATPEFASQHFADMTIRKFVMSHPMDKEEIAELVNCFRRDYLYEACEHEMRRAGFGPRMAPITYTKQQFASLMVLSRWFVERQEMAIAMIVSWEPIKPIIEQYVCQDAERVILLYCGDVRQFTRRTKRRLPWCMRWHDMHSNKHHCH